MRQTRFASRPSFPALALAAGLGLLLTLGGCGDTSGGGDATQASNRPDPTPAETVTAPATEARPAETKTPPQGTTPPVAGGMGQIKFENRFHDFGVIDDTKKQRAVYQFTNAGDGMLNITEVKAGCGCTVPSLDKYDYLPGESGEIEIVFDPKGRKGKSTKYVTVRSNSKVEDMLQLRFAAQIEPLVRLDRFMQFGTIELGKEHKKTIVATYTDPDLEFLEVKINDDYMGAKLLESGVVDDSAGGGAITYRATVEVTVHPDIPWGTLYAKRLSMKVRGRTAPEADPIEYDYSVYVQGNVYGQISASTASRGRAASPTSTISLSSMDAGQPFEARLTLTRANDQPFTITDATIADTTWKGVEARYEQTGTNTWDLIVFGDPGTYTGSVRGTVHVTTDVPGETMLPVRFTGRVK